MRQHVRRQTAVREQPSSLQPLLDDQLYGSAQQHVFLLDHQISHRIIRLRPIEYEVISRLIQLQQQLNWEPAGPGSGSGSSAAAASGGQRASRYLPSLPRFVPRSWLATWPQEHLSRAIQRLSLWGLALAQVRGTGASRGYLLVMDPQGSAPADPWNAEAGD